MGSRWYRLYLLMTSLGAAMVFFFKKAVSANIQRIFLGFAAGVMIAASVWSLLIPAMEEAQAAGVAGWLPAGGGFVLGVAFLMLLDSLLPHLHPGAKQAEGLDSKWQRSTMLMLAVTLHNIPEGMAVGLAFALAAHRGQGAACHHAGHGTAKADEHGHDAAAGQADAAQQLIHHRRRHAPCSRYPSSMDKRGRRTRCTPADDDGQNTDQHADPLP